MRTKGFTKMQTCAYDSKTIQSINIHMDKNKNDNKNGIS